jgi:hypothetical protein
MPVPQYTGSISVPALGAFSSATSVPATFAAAIQAGPNSLGLISVGDIEANRSATTGAMLLGGATERGVLDFGISNAHTTTLSGTGGSSTGNFIVTGSIGFGSPIAIASVNASQTLFTPAGSTRPFVFANAAGTVSNVIFPNAGGIQTIQTGVNSVLSYVPPTFTAAGAAVASTLHAVVGTVTAGGASTTVTFSGPSAFTSNTSYAGFCYSITDAAYVAFTAYNSGNVTFTSVNGHVYQFFFIGT